MPRYTIVNGDEVSLQKIKGLVSWYTQGDMTIIARYEVNRTTLKRLLKNRLEKGDIL